MSALSASVLPPHMPIGSCFNEYSRQCSLLAHELHNSMASLASVLYFSHCSRGSPFSITGNHLSTLCPLQFPSAGGVSQFCNNLTPYVGLGLVILATSDEERNTRACFTTRFPEISVATISIASKGILNLEAIAAFILLISISSSTNFMLSSIFAGMAPAVKAFITPSF